MLPSEEKELFLGQGVQLSFPGRVLYVPASHATHRRGRILDPSKVEPGSHCAWGAVMLLAVAAPRNVTETAAKTMRGHSWVIRRESVVRWMLMTLPALDARMRGSAMRRQSGSI